MRCVLLRTFCMSLINDHGNLRLDNFNDLFSSHEVCPIAYSEELTYWGISELFVEPCCQELYYGRYVRDMITITIFTKLILEDKIAVIVIMITIFKHARIIVYHLSVRKLSRQLLSRLSSSQLSPLRKDMMQKANVNFHNSKRTL